jgi:hypothetical protein
MKLHEKLADGGLFLFPKNRGTIQLAVLQRRLTFRLRRSQCPGSRCIRDNPQLHLPPGVIPAQNGNPWERGIARARLKRPAVPQRMR